MQYAVDTAVDRDGEVATSTIGVEAASRAAAEASVRAGLEGEGAAVVSIVARRPRPDEQAPTGVAYESESAVLRQREAAELAAAQQDEDAAALAAFVASLRGS